MKILVVGGAGYVGSALVPVLADRGYEITVADQFWFGNHLPARIPIIEKDVFDMTEDDLKGFEQVVFMAGLSNDPMAEFSPALNFISNAASPAYLGYIARKVGVRRFVFSGSCSVYGYTEDRLYDETSPTISNFPYGVSKLQGEQSLISMGNASFSVISLRKGTVSGYSPRMRLDLIVNTMFKAAVEKGEIAVNNPAIWRPILSIQDAIAAYVLAIEANNDISGVFNIASGNYTVGEVAERVKGRLEPKLDRKVRLNILNRQDFRNYKVSTEKAAKVLGFRPTHDIESIVDDLHAHLDRFKDFANPNYYNIEVFKKLQAARR
jgi:nucleoside-diphosphate-sugar epimerase